MLTAPFSSLNSLKSDQFEFVGDFRQEMEEKGYTARY